MNPIRHIEFWVSNIEQSVAFYEPLLSLLGWDHIDANGFSCGGTKIYFRKMDCAVQDALGPRHICFQANVRGDVDKVGKLLKEKKAMILHGPEVIHAGGSYMIVFKDPDGYILEVGYKKHA